MTKNVLKKRGAGVLLHISSLPSKYGIGSLGNEAYRFVDFLHNSAQRYWQVLPIAPTGISNSPYQSYSAFAFNHYFIDLEALYEDGLLADSDLFDVYVEKNNFVDFKNIYISRNLLLRKAFSNYNKKNADFLRFVETSNYLEYACYMTLKSKFGGLPWYMWQNEYKYCSKNLIKKVFKECTYEVSFFLWIQFTFINQWKKLKNYANDRGVKIIGDIPIYIDYDSVECWINPKILQLNKDLKPIAVAGVPPDYFSETGQLWGNPLYDWDYIKNNRYMWWKKRIAIICSMCDYVRIDHFRGFHEYYSIPYDSANAKSGDWKKGPGTEFFESLNKVFKKKIIAEDLGLLDQGALNFFNKLGYPGMKVLQFAFDGNNNNPHLPQNYADNSVVYSGTHDNDTLLGWISSVDDLKTIKSRIIDAANKLGINTRVSERMDLCRLVIEIALSSPSDICIIPIQDYLGLDSNSRMNTPGTVSDKNWSFKLTSIPYELSGLLYNLSINYKRK